MQSTQEYGQCEESLLAATLQKWEHIGSDLGEVHLAESKLNCCLPCLACYRQPIPVGLDEGIPQECKIRDHAVRTREIPQQVVNVAPFRVSP